MSITTLPQIPSIRSYPTLNNLSPNVSLTPPSPILSTESPALLTPRTPLSPRITKITPIVTPQTNINSENLYLDGRYFNKALNLYPGLVKESFNINIIIDNNKVSVTTNFVEKITKLVPQGISDKYLIRLIINTFIMENGIPQLKSKHSNLLIGSDKEKYIYRFEPINNPYDVYINDAIRNDLRATKKFIGYTYDEYDVHPQSDLDLKDNSSIHKGLCVAYVLYFALATAENKPIFFKNNNQIVNFAKNIINRYGAFPNNDPDADIEFGWGGAFLGGALVGGLLGAGLVGAATVSRPINSRTTTYYY